MGGQVVGDGDPEDVVGQIRRDTKGQPPAQLNGNIDNGDRAGNGLPARRGDRSPSLNCLGAFGSLHSTEI
jgi:hypothetical protein